MRKMPTQTSTIAPPIPIPTPSATSVVRLLPCPGGAGGFSAAFPFPGDEGEFRADDGPVALVVPPTGGEGVVVSFPGGNDDAGGAAPPAGREDIFADFTDYCNCYYYYCKGEVFNTAAM